MSIDKSEVQVEQEIGEVRHQLPMAIFNEALRITADETLIGTSQFIKAQIYAANLSLPQEFLLKLNFV